MSQAAIEKRWDRYIEAVSAGKGVEEQGRLYWEAVQELAANDPHIHCWVEVEVNLTCSSCSQTCTVICDECGRRSCDSHKGASHA